MVLLGRLPIPIEDHCNISHSPQPAWNFLRKPSYPFQTLSAPAPWFAHIRSTRSPPTADNISTFNITFFFVGHKGVSCARRVRCFAFVAIYSCMRICCFGVCEREWVVYAVREWLSWFKTELRRNEDECRWHENERNYDGPLLLFHRLPTTRIHINIYQPCCVVGSYGCDLCDHF